MLMSEQFWVEKFRPQNERLYPSRWLERNTSSHCGFWRDAKNFCFWWSRLWQTTAAAIAMCKEMGAEDQNQLFGGWQHRDTLRTRIRDFATSQSLTGHQKVVILDEFDYANANSFQPALRGFIEEFSVQLSLCPGPATSRNRIIEPLHSRCTCVDFRFTKEEQMKMGSQFWKDWKASYRARASTMTWSCDRQADHASCS